METGPLMDIAGVGDPVAVAQTNFETLTRDAYKFTPTYQSGAATTTIGPPTTGAHILDERWSDANLAEWRCTVAGTPGTWRQETPAVVAADPGSGTIPNDYLIRRSDLYGVLRRHVGSYVWADVLPATVASGTYAPTLTNVANLDASNAFTCQYTRVGNVVTVTGKVSVDPTAGAATQLGISLPVASNIAAEEQVGGVAFSPTVAGQGAAIVGDAANNRAEMQWVAVDTALQVMSFSFSYLVV